MADDNDKKDELEYTDVGIRAGKGEPRTEEGIERPQGEFGLGPLDKKYEATDISLRPIFVTAIIIGVMTLAAYVILYGLFIYWTAREEVKDQARLPISQGADQIPPEPQLQPMIGGRQSTETGDWIAYIAAEQVAANEYAWVDRAGGKARVPVDVAIDILAKRGLPIGAEWQMAPGTVMIQGVVMTEAEAAAQQEALQRFSQRQGAQPAAGTPQGQVQGPAVGTPLAPGAPAGQPQTGNPPRPTAGTTAPAQPPQQ